MRTIRIFDTTLRDGEQAPGASMSREEKMQVALQLEVLGVDIVEAGFPAASPDDFRAVSEIASKLKKTTVCALARAVEKDIAAAADALSAAKKRRIHTFLATSDVHLQYKLRMTREEALMKIETMVRYAKSFGCEVEFSPEDGSRSDIGFLYRALEAAIRAGATVLNIPDTVGYAVPEEFGKLIAGIRTHVRGAEDVTISVHCHDDLGLATANALAAVKAGAGQVECTINGIGERAGNASLEEVVMALRTRKEFFDCTTNVVTKELYATSRLVSTVTGFPVPPNKAIVGSNAFAHESGIHQDGILKKRETYEIMRAEDVGIVKNRLVLGKHSGRAALGARLVEMGYALTAEELGEVFVRFKELADSKKEVFDEDLRVLCGGSMKEEGGTWRVVEVGVKAGTKGVPEAAITLLSPTGKKVSGKATGTGPVDAAYTAVQEIIGEKVKLLEFSMQAVTAGIDAQAVVIARVEDGYGQVVTGRGADTDIIVASVKGFVDAINGALLRGGAVKVRAQG